MKTLKTTRLELSLSKSVAPEDLHCGDFVAILNVIYEFPPFFGCQDTPMVPDSEPLRVQFSSPDGGRPLKVKAICLPYVFVKSPGGRCRTLDIRHCQLVRLNDGYAESVWKTLRRQKKKQQQARS